MFGIRTVRSLRLFALTAALCSSAAFAAEPVSTESAQAALKTTEEHPWSKGVSLARQDAAERFFTEGNALFALPDFIRAAQKYREALEQWDHPTIHYNLGLALNNLDNPIEAYKQFELAMKFGGAPLEEKHQVELRRHFKTTARQISILELSCQQPNALVTLDGKAIALPTRLLLQPGQHQIVAKKDGYETREYNLALFPGTPKKVEVRLFTEEQLTESRRPVPYWVPIAVTGAGVGMVITGAILATRSNDLRQRYDDYLADKYPNGTKASKTPLDYREDAATLETWSTISYIAGATTVVGGAVWTYLNGSKTRRYTPEEREGQTTVTPIVTGNMLGAITTGRF